MNFLKSSFFSDFKLQNVLALNQEDQISSSRNAESFEDSVSVFSDSEGEGSSEAKRLPDSGSVTVSSSDAGTSSQEAGMWGLGGLMKSITLKSEGILQAYRKDLEEFGSGLKKETQMIAEVAVHVVKDLPTSLEAGAYIAQESIESVGQAVEDFSSSVWHGTADLIAQGKDAVLRMEEDENPVISTAATVSSSSSISRYDNAPAPISGGKYSRFEAQVRAMQHDSTTYCDEPADLADYTAWKDAFRLSDKMHDIDNLVTENTFLREILVRFIPDVVSEEVFWTRYFYRLHKLQQAEEARAGLVKRAIAIEEEDLSWDTEEEIDDGGTAHDEQNTKGNSNNSQGTTLKDTSREGVQEDLGETVRDGVLDGSSSQKEPKDFMGTEGIVNAAPEDEDELGWEVAEDVEESSSNDGKRSSNSETSWEMPEVSREDLQKRFAAQEQDEDLTWDVDDGDDSK